MAFKAVVTWLVFLLIGVIHTHVRDGLVAPQIGQTAALWLGLVVYSVAILGVVVVFIFQNEISGQKDKWVLSLTWIILSLGYKIGVSCLVWEKSFSVMAREATSMGGLVFALELGVVALSPWIADFYLRRFDIRENAEES